MEPLTEKISADAKTDGASSVSAEPADPVGPGDLCKVRVLYEGAPKCRCCINWVEDKPENLRESIEEQTESKKNALLVRMKKNHGDGKPLMLHSIVVQNKHLKELLGQVFNGYSGITTTLKKLVFYHPFHEFFYEWEHLNELCKSQTEPRKKSLGYLLQEVLASELEETISQSKDLTMNEVITYDYLWTLFRPGIEVYSSQSGYDSIYKLVKASYAEASGQSYFQLELQCVDCDGHKFGWKTVQLGIWRYSGTRTLTQLEVIPMSLHPRSQELKLKTETRGRSARDYQSVVYHYATYNGIAKSVNNKKFNINGRIIVDAAAYELFNPHQKVSLKPLESFSSQATIDVSDKSQDHMSDARHFHYESRRMKSSMVVAPEQFSELTNVDKKKNPIIPLLDDKYLPFCSPEVRGYCLQTKQWVTFDVDMIKPVRWNKTAFQNLVIEEDYKRLILAFVESQVANKDTFDDLIQGKGRGLIMLLEGSPGVGKTLTAEAVADRVQRPLYALSGGELGRDSSQLESNLSMILDVATKWDAVLLLDECDVFLEKRSVNNLPRNSTVAVLLRMLEYYQGILFMTTNRIKTIDPAFQSRIHLTITYPKLDQEARHTIWTHFLRVHCVDAQVLDEEIQELAQADMNGREIKNLVKTAQLLARHEKSILTAEHFRIVSQVFKQRPFSSCGDSRTITHKKEDSADTDGQKRSGQEAGI